MKKKSILMVTSSYDKTCDYLIAKFTHLNFFRLNLDKFSEYSITYSHDGFNIKNTNGEIENESCLSIYFRKPSMEKLDGIFDSLYHSYVHKETYSVIEGIVECFNGTVLTKPSIMRRANNKIFQASLANQVGFNLPEYAITNDVTILKHFSEQKGIIKPVAIGEITSSSSKEFVQTNLLTPSFNTSKFHYSPAYLQNYINKDYEVRLTIIGKNIFPIKIYSQNNIDWRKPNNKVRYETCSIPEHIKINCFRFMDLCEMKFGCFDFIIKENVWYFLEMNANGQWAWLEFETGVNISGTIIDYLITDKTQMES